MVIKIGGAMYKLGIDVGYATFKYIILDEKDKVLSKEYIFHKGKIEKVYEHLIKTIEALGSQQVIVGVTGDLAERLPIYKRSSINHMMAIVEGAMYKHSNIKSIIELGAQGTHFINHIDKNQKSKVAFYTNSSCAAGTGAFLEEQATRLGIQVEDLSEYIKEVKQIPRIAGRCSVFSKTDMIHRMQEGATINEVLLGLCYALVRNYKANVVQKHVLEKPVMLVGGVIHNAGVLRAIKEVFQLKEDEIICDEDHSYVAAYGACQIAMKKAQVVTIEDLKTQKELVPIKESSLFPPLSRFGIEDAKEKHVCFSKARAGYLGIDIGSTSVNLVVIDEANQVIDYIYTKTEGKPKEVVLENIDKLKQRLGKDFIFKGIGTTGSGRVLIGKLLKADLVVNEIIAQAKGGSVVEPGVDTIFEIGGQDSKYIHLDKGLVNQFEMNKICAAGTGAFIEEQIKKLGIELGEFGEWALKGQYPVDLGERCTVFIEGNIGKAIAEGKRIEDISAGLAYAIVKNYLNRVVGNRQIGEKVLLQGGIAHNQGVVNAFRALLGKPVIVPPFFSVTGALGMAVLTKEYLQQQQTVSQPQICDDLKERSESYYLAGYTGERNLHKKTIGIPRVLFLNKMFPMFNEIFTKLGYNVILSEASNEEIVALSQEYAFEETCFPVKLITGHFAWLLKKKVDYIFLPQLHTMKHAGSKAREDYACTYMQTSPKIMESIFDLKGKVELIAPILSFNFGKEYMIETLLSIGKQLGKNKVETTLAVMSGMKKFMHYEKQMEELGHEMLKNIPSHQKVFVLVSRVYNLVDPTLNMGIEDKLKEMGYPVLHLGHLEAGHMQLKEEYHAMCWPFGQHILTGIEVIKNHPHMFPIYITNHGCGPDTVLTHYFKQEMGDRPYLHIEIDEHASKIGILTRLEAFAYSLHQYEHNSMIDRGLQQVQVTENNSYMLPHLPLYSEVTKQFLEKTGSKVEILKPVDDESIEIGKGLATSKEYFSMLAMGSEVIQKVQASSTRQTLYFPITEGNETFSQYGQFIRIKTREIGREIGLKTPFLEDFLKEEEFGLPFATAILACDLISLLPSNERREALEEVLEGIRAESLGQKEIEQIAHRVNKYHSNHLHRKKLMVIGEPLVVYKPYLNEGILEALETTHMIMKQPLAEVLFALWYDYSHKRQKKNRLYEKKLGELQRLVDSINQILKENSPFSANMSQMLAYLEDILPQYAGGMGRYRLAKVLTTKNVDGILMLSSMYENTATITKMLREKHKSEDSVPLLELNFDCNKKSNYREIIETFLNYIEE